MDSFLIQILYSKMINMLLVFLLAMGGGMLIGVGGEVAWDSFEASMR